MLLVGEQGPTTRSRQSSSGSRGISDSRTCFGLGTREELSTSRMSSISSFEGSKTVWRHALVKKSSPFCVATKNAAKSIPKLVSNYRNATKNVSYLVDVMAGLAADVANERYLARKIRQMGGF